MKRTVYAILLPLFIVMAGTSACHTGQGSKAANVREERIKVGPVRVNTHPSSLSGKTVLLRWNGQCNGDTFLNSMGQLLKQEIKQIRIVKMWEIEPGTAVISSGLPESQTIAEAVAAQKPALVIAAQADSG